MYKSSFTVIFIDNCNKAYNWLNGEYVEFDDLSHPYCRILKQGIEEFEAFQYCESFVDFNWLLENDFILETAGAIERKIKNQLEEERIPDSLHLILLPAGTACNFRCVYCYEGHNVSKYMGGREKDAILGLIKKRKLSRLHIEYFGGEPLLNADFILDLSNECNQLVDEIFTFSASMTTNGYLLNVELFKAFIGLNIRLFRKICG